MHIPFMDLPMTLYPLLFSKIPQILPPRGHQINDKLYIDPCHITFPKRDRVILIYIPVNASGV